MGGKSSKKSNNLGRRRQLGAAWSFNYGRTPVEGLADRDRVDHGLHRAFVFILPQNKHEFVGFVLGQFKGVDVFKNVGSAHR